MKKGETIVVRNKFKFFLFQVDKAGPTANYSHRLCMIIACLGRWRLLLVSGGFTELGRGEMLSSRNLGYVREVQYSGFAEAKSGYVKRTASAGKS